MVNKENSNENNYNNNSDNPINPNSKGRKEDYTQTIPETPSVASAKDSNGRTIDVTVEQSKEFTGFYDSCFKALLDKYSTINEEGKPVFTEQDRSAFYQYAQKEKMNLVKLASMLQNDGYDGLANNFNQYLQDSQQVQVRGEYTQTLQTLKGMDVNIGNLPSIKGIVSKLETGTELTESETAHLDQMAFLAGMFKTGLEIYGKRMDTIDGILQIIKTQITNTGSKVDILDKKTAEGFRSVNSNLSKVDAGIADVNAKTIETKTAVKEGTQETVKVLNAAEEKIVKQAKETDKKVDSFGRLVSELYDSTVQFAKNHYGKIALGVVLATIGTVSPILYFSNSAKEEAVKAQVAAVQAQTETKNASTKISTVSSKVESLSEGVKTAGTEIAKIKEKTTLDSEINMFGTMLKPYSDGDGEDTTFEPWKNAVNTALVGNITPDSEYISIGRSMVTTSEVATIEQIVSPHIPHMRSITDKRMNKVAKKLADELTSKENTDKKAVKWAWDKLVDEYDRLKPESQVSLLGYILSGSQDLIKPYMPTDAKLTREDIITTFIAKAEFDNKGNVTQTKDSPKPLAIHLINKVEDEKQRREKEWENNVKLESLRRGK